jgi:hypothetical protein
MSTADQRIFLSHAYADRAVADLLRDTLVLGGVAEKRIFYSSSRSTGVPSGEGIRNYLQSSLRQSGLVIELLTKTFFTRPMCLMELGGAWTLGTATYPIVVPPLSRSEAVAQIGDIQMGQLQADSDIDEVFEELHDRLMRDVGIDIQMGSWKNGIGHFKTHWPPAMSPIAPAPAPASATPATSPSLAESSKSAPPNGASNSPTEPSRPALVTLKNVSVTEGDRGRAIIGEACNSDQKQHNIVLKATFVDAENVVMVKIYWPVTRIAPASAKPFRIEGVPDSHDYQLCVSQVL